MDNIDNINKKIVTVIENIENIQRDINNSTDKVKFVKGEYTISQNLYLKENIEYDGCGSTLNLKDCSVVLNSGVSNMFENFHETEEDWATCINLKSSSKATSNAQNFIGYNRFEYPYSIKYKYKIRTSNTTVFEPFLKINEVSTPIGSYGNSVMVFGDTKLENYRNQFFIGNGQGYDISSILRVMSRTDSDSKDLRDIKPSIVLSTKQGDEVIDRLTITSTNEFYETQDQSFVSFGQNGLNAFNIYKGMIQLGSRVDELTDAGEGSVIFNNQTKKIMGFNGT